MAKINVLKEFNELEAGDTWNAGDLTIYLHEIDNLDRECFYYLFEVDNKYLKTLNSSDFTADTIADAKTYTNTRHMYKRSDFTDKEWEIVKYLFLFLWNSSNGTNTCVEQDVYEDDGFKLEDFQEVMNKFDFNDTLEEYEEGGIEIYWDYFSCFDLTSCNFWEGK